MFNLLDALPLDLKRIEVVNLVKGAVIKLEEVRRKGEEKSTRYSDVSIPHHPHGRRKCEYPLKS